jgi:glycosyltransferase involved in cell wall biosynthesis
MRKPIYFVVPGSLAVRTGGYGYDRNIVERLRGGGWAIETIELGGQYPDPDSATRAKAEEIFASIPSDALVVIDGLAFGAMPEIAEKEHDRLKLVALVHHPLADETGIGEDLSRKLMRSETAALRFAARIIATSRFTSRRLVEMGVDREKIFVVEPGVASAPLAARRFGGEGSALNMLCPASYIARKGHADLLTALSGLSELPWSLICVGNNDLDSNCYGDMVALRDALGLGGRVELRAEVNDRELEKLFASSDLVALASHYEGFGMVVPEAIAHGLPVVTTTGGALAETLPSDAGLASPPGDRESLRENLRNILEDKNLYRRLCENAEAARAKLKSWDEAARAFAAVLEA